MPTINLDRRTRCRAAAVANSLGTAFESYLLDSTWAAALVARPATPEAINQLVADRIASDYVRFVGVDPGEPPGWGPPVVVVAGPSLAAQVEVVAGYRGQPVGEYLERLYERASPAEGPAHLLAEVAARLSALIEGDFAGVPEETHCISTHR